MPAELTPTGWCFTGKTTTEAMTVAIRHHLEMEKPDAVLNIETHLFNTTIASESCAFNLDVGKDLWLNQSRWSRLMKEYVPKEPLDRFVDQAIEIITGGARTGATANMLFRDPERYTKKHRWGGCLMGATFRGDGKKAGHPTITFYSRTTYMGYMGLLDAGIGTVIAYRIRDRMAEQDKLWQSYKETSGLPIGFRWHISSQQLHCFKTLPYIYSKPDLMARIEKYERNRKLIDKLPPTWKYLSKWYCKVVDHWDEAGHDPEKMLKNEKYGPFKRIKRRWMEHKRHLAKHVPKSLKLDQLDFGKCI